MHCDGYILLSRINTKLRDNYSSLEELCEEEELDIDEVTRILSGIGYAYDAEKNAFKQI